MNRCIAKAWLRSRTYRALLILATLYAVARLGVQGVYLAGALPGQPKEYPIPVDLQVYWDAAEHFRARQDVYLQGDLTSIEYHLPYPPSFAWAFTPFLLLPPRAVAVIHTLLHIAAYAWMYARWMRISERLGLDRFADALARTLPAWLIFAAFWSDLGYLNIYIILALLATLLIDAVLHERLGWSALWLSLILQTKPM